MAHIDTFEKVAGIVGNAMDEAWKKIMTQLSAGNIAAFDGSADIPQVGLENQLI
jgi:hypothetical protein